MARSLLPHLFSPSREMDPFTALQRETDRLFQDFARSWRTGGQDLALWPATDVTETEQAIEVTAEIPGMTDRDVEVTLAENTLTIRGEKKMEREEKEANRYLTERSWGSFTRSIDLPAGTDSSQISATCKNGVLKVIIPRAKGKKQDVQRIEVKSSS